MALVRFGNGVSEIRGSVAGTVFSRSAAGAIARNRTTPVQPNTVPQSLARARMQTAADLFYVKSLAEIDEWKLFAETQTRINRLGEDYKPSGKQLFTETSLNLQLIGTNDEASLASLVSDPNLPGITGYEIDYTIAAGLIDVIRFINFSATAQTTHVVIQATPPMPPSFRNTKKYMRQVTVTPIASLDFTADYIALFGDVAPLGLAINFRARALNGDNGLGGAWIYDSVELATP